MNLLDVRKHYVEFKYSRLKHSLKIPKLYLISKEERHNHELTQAQMSEIRVKL